MTMKYALLAFALFTAPALAQQSSTPSQVALQLTTVLAQWAQALEALQRQNVELHTQLEAVTKERDELKAKLEAAKP